jgi:hypothetical protein
MALVAVVQKGRLVAPASIVWELESIVIHEFVGSTLGVPPTQRDNQTYTLSAMSLHECGKTRPWRQTKYN